MTEEIESSFTNKAEHTETRSSHTAHGRFLLIQNGSIGILVLFYDGNYQGDELGPEIQVPDAGALFLRRKVLIFVLGRKPLENQCQFKGERKKLVNVDHHITPITSGPFLLKKLQLLMSAGNLCGLVQNTVLCWVLC